MLPGVFLKYNCWFLIELVIMLCQLLVILEYFYILILTYLEGILNLEKYLLGTLL